MQKATQSVKLSVPKPPAEITSAFGLAQDIHALVADDHPMNRKIMRMIFAKKFLWRVTEAESAEAVSAKRLSHSS